MNDISIKVYISDNCICYFSVLQIGSEEMCYLKEEFEEPNTVRECKRKRFRCDFGEIYRPPKRLSPFLNTPKEKKEERKKILKISIKKLKKIENAELCLKRSLLIQNTVRRLQKELRLDKRTKSWRNSVKTARMGYRFNTSTYYMKKYFMYDDPVINDVNENISDDMTDTLMKNLQEKIGGRLGCNTNGDDSDTSPSICVTPALDIYENTASPRT